MGAGATELWDAVVDHLDADARSPPPLAVGSVLESYERSAYVELAEDLTASVPTPGPSLALLAGPGFSGPLAVRIRSPTAHPFRGDALAAGDRCRLRPATGGDQQRFVLSVGRSLDVEIASSVLAAEPTQDPPLADVTTVSRGDPVWRQARAVLERAAASGAEDGLGWTPALRRAASGEAGDHPLRTLAAGWADAVTAGSGATGGLPGVELLGRGPGATPSGDDITAGILLTLLRATRPPAHGRVRALGDRLVSRAADRTTTVSTAVLAQAARGRAADEVDAGLRALLTPSTDADRRREAVDAMTALGHTSGADMLVGVLLTLLLIAPAVEP